jgi:hypothetical protein
MAKDLNIDDLNGPATGQDLYHLVQLYKLQQFMAKRAVDLLHKEVSAQPDSAEPLVINQITLQSREENSRSHKDVIEKVLKVSNESIDKRKANTQTDYWRYKQINKQNQEINEMLRHYIHPDRKEDDIDNMETDLQNTNLDYDDWIDETEI